MSCRDCGEQMEGDGYTTVFHCPNVDVSGITPDCDPVYCEADDELSEFDDGENIYADVISDACDKAIQDLYNKL